ncbi:MAG: hypothetical protein J4F31_07595 [Flavobacteriales bacterium]|nr:hypothetical protein [Flavobacteriales bacterium]
MLHLHSTLAVLVLLFLVFGVIRGFMGGRQEVFGAIDKRITLLTLIFAHLQLVIGLYLWFSFMSAMHWDMGTIMGDSVLRLKGVEHITIMIFAVIMITMVRSRTKKMTDAKKQYRAMLIGYGVALLLVLVRIPWNQWSLLQ